MRITKIHCTCDIFSHFSGNCLFPPFLFFPCGHRSRFNNFLSKNHLSLSLSHTHSLKYTQTHTHNFTNAVTKRGKPQKRIRANTCCSISVLSMHISSRVWILDFKRNILYVNICFFSRKTWNTSIYDVTAL